MTCTLSVQSKVIMGISSRSNIQLNVRKLNLSFYDAKVIYGANNLDQYLLTVAPSLSYTSIYTYNGNYTTSVDSDTSSLAMTDNSLYYYQNVFNSSYKSSEVGQLDYSIVFGTETLSNTHIYY
jgi:hypothetical protein